ncbi:S-layer homology domain-containing protein [Paenibacillus terricola]|uniref:S-layer homology domain-containing protein n=1 Tax=Paenibacillus terricola TaxID=2763503 RepID=UPI001CD04785|nr:S-layer homology domain-containing protein [Paenibacillus terricola]
MQISKFKKFAISTMAAAILLSGASSAFAKGNDDHDHDKNNGKDDKKSSSNVTINVNFKDEEDLKWATEYIIRLASKGIVNGYSDGTFKPNQKITRIETIVAAVRLMGLREQAESTAEMNSNLNFKDADQLKKKYPWAVGYVAVALENDLFAETEDQIQPEKPATRLWSTTILVKALKLEAEAKAKSNTKLSFKDAKQIPAGSVGYVQVALEKGIITGYNDNTFRPNQQVTRAELAALLDRTDSQLPNQDDTAVTGTLKASVSNNSLTVVKADKTEKSLSIDPNVFIFRDNKKAALSDLKAGDEVLVRTYNGKVIFVEVTKMAEATNTLNDIKGTLKSAGNNSIVVVKSDKSESSLTLDTNAIIYRDNKVAALADLKAGDEVLVRTLNGKVIFIQVTKLAQTTPTVSDFKGTLKAAASNNSITVVKSDKSESTLTLDTNAIIYRDNKVATLADLKAGDEVQVRTLNGKVIFIQVTKLAQTTPTISDFKGTLKAAASNNSITVVKSDKSESTLTLDSSVIIYRDSKTATLADLKAGDEVQVRTFNGKVIFIQVTKLASDAATVTDVKGTLKAAASNNSITVVKSDKSESTLAVDSNAIIYRDNKTVTLADLKAGDEVLVRTINGKVIFIQVTKLASDAATVTDVKGTLKAAASNNSITVVKSDKSESTLTVDSNAIIYRDNKTVALADLKAGDEVLVRTINGKVILIQVTKLASDAVTLADITGTLKASASGNSIVVVKSDKTESTVTFDSSVVIYRDGKTAAITDLKAGDELLVRTINGKAIFIQVTKLAPVGTTIEAGNFNSVSLNSQGKISTISITRTVNGSLQAYIFNVASDVVISGEASKLVTGQSVELTLVNNVVKVIVIK